MYSVIILSDLEINRKTGAAFNRMVEYARGLSKIDYTTVYISSLIIKNEFDKMQEISERVFLTGNKSIRRTNFFLNRYFCFFRKKLQLQVIVERFKGDSKNTVFIIYNFFSTFWEEIYFFYCLKRQGFKVFTERNERSLGITFNTLTPPGIIQKVAFTLMKLFEFVNSTVKDESVRFYDGTIVISSSIEKWLNKRNKNNIRIPILANHETLNSNNELLPNDDILKLGYTGSISFNRDGVDTLISAVNILVKDFNLNVKLTITGYGAKTTVEAIKSKIQGLNLQNIIDLAGYVNNTKYLEIVREQDVFVILRRNNLQGRFSFSSKIAEYMALGKLVLTTPVSDNSFFIKDNINGFIVDDLNSKKIAEKIFEIINLPDNKLNEIRSAARVTALTHFNIEKYSKRLFNFLFPASN
jgi:glycosyltransferase involved in cell wall biosynthesis